VEFDELACTRAGGRYPASESTARTRSADVKRCVYAWRGACTGVCTLGPLSDKLRISGFSANASKAYTFTFQSVDLVETVYKTLLQALF